MNEDEKIVLNGEQEAALGMMMSGTSLCVGRCGKRIRSSIETRNSPVRAIRSTGSRSSGLSRPFGVASEVEKYKRMEERR